MRRYIFVADSLAQIACDSLGHSSCVYEDESRSMSGYQLSKTVVYLVPHFTRHHCAEWRAGDFNSEIQLAPVTRVDDRAVGRSVFIDVCRAHQETRYLFDRLLRRRKPDPDQIVSHKLLKPLDRECEVRASFVADHRVNFVYDQRARGPEHSPAAFAGQQYVKRLGRGDDDVRRAFGHRGAFRGGRVTGANHRANV